ncbi:MAG: ATP-binding protein [Xanthomonadales bacterium]|jgi:HSP90 family molecular chaperone|nr:ATP-binding protein [Xanthomonadales bacterium]
MTLDFEGLMGILANSLYSEKKVFIRELVQNGHDGIRRREKRESHYYGRIDIESRPEEGWISFMDNGIGMSDEDLNGYLSRIGASGTKTLGRESEAVSGLVGKFGIGFLSGFIVAERVEVRTRKMDSEFGWLWKNDGGQQYSLERCDREVPGTTVKVYIKDPLDRALIEAESVIKVVREYCDMLRVPIHVNRGAAPVNTQVMPWEREGLSEEETDLDCRIYLARTILGDSLIETFPVRLEAPFRAGGILYVSKMRTFGVRVPRNLRIYQDRMYVSNDADLLPPWAEFVSGIIETSGLTPNAARDGFIRNAAWSKLRDALGEVIIQGMDRLRTHNRRQLSYILKYHELGIKAACYHHEPFFQKFAHLLEWRVNRLPNSEHDRDDDDLLGVDRRGDGVAFHWRTLPEVLAASRSEPGRAQRLLTFTTSNAANQYFEMANAEGVLVVDASYQFEGELIASYVKLADVPPVELVYVDKQGGGLFKELESTDLAVRRLAEAMGQFIVVGGVGRLRVEARRFQPPSLPAVLLNAEQGNADLHARQILLDPTSASHLREMAEELLRHSRRGSAMRMVINANSPFIRELAQLDSKDRDVQHVMLGVYNSAILYNAELLTPRNAKIFHDQFGDFMESNIRMIKARGELEQARDQLEQERRALRRLEKSEMPSAAHRIVFLMTPFHPQYAGLEAALRAVIEDRWACQLCLARDQILNPELRGNVEAHMQQAHAFIAEVSQGNPNVMYEVGRARALYPTRPMIFLSHPSPDTGKVTLPADLGGLLRIEYALDSAAKELADHLEKELRKSAAITALLDMADLDDFVPVTLLRQYSRPYALQENTLQALATRFSTAGAWRQAEATRVLELVAADGLDPDDAAGLIRKIQRALLST